MKCNITKFLQMYIIFYALYSMSTRIIPTANWCVGPLADLLYKIVILGAGVFALWTIYRVYKTIKPTPQLILLGVFILILGISTILNHQYGLMDNILGMATFVAQLITFFFLPYTMSKKEIGATLRHIGLIGCLLWTPACGVSLFQYVTNIHYTIENPAGNTVRQGITDGRLFGVFSDPNFAAFTSLILILLLIYSRKTSTGKALRIYCVVNIIVNLVYLIMSNSRTIYIAAVGTLFFFLFFRTYEQHKVSKEPVQKFFLALLKRFVVGVFGIVVVYSLIFFPLQQAGKMLKPERQVNDMVREDVNTSNITNNRSTIWKHYLTLCKDKPVFGFSIQSALPYATEHYPGSYLDITQYVTHNGYLSLLVETGITGFAIMGAFLILILISSVKRVRIKEKISHNYMLCANLIVATLIFLVCFHDVFFTVNIETFLLYLSIGYLSYANISSMSARH